MKPIITVLPRKVIHWVRTAFVLAGVVVLQGCEKGNRSMMLGQFPPEATLVCVGHDGRMLQTVVTNGEPLADLIEKWSRDNTSGWSKSYDTFAPSVEFRAPDISLNVRSDFVVANMKKPNGKWIQLKKPTPASLWNDITKLVAVKTNEIAPK
jgi:hypothetical protein